MARENAKWRHTDVANWAEREFGRKFAQSTISETLSNKYAYTDDAKPSKALKRRLGQFPLLEKALIELVYRLNSAGHPTNGDSIISLAQKLWATMPDFQGQPVPSFSQGWLSGFKQRQNLKRFKKRGEASSTKDDDLTAGLEAAQKLCAAYDPNNVYNAHETGLFWKATPEYTIASGPQRGWKQNKDRITILPCCNATGTHRLQLWVIGIAANPRVFGRHNHKISSMPLHYRNNKTACMTGSIFSEWLKWFDAQMAGRRVLLLLDNFSAHERAFQDGQAQGWLQNTQVHFLPKLTALFQPMDQGIINNLKVYYKTLWLEFFCRLVFQNRNPLQEVTMLKAVIWLIDAWHNSVKDITIANCWSASQLLGPHPGPPQRPKDWDESRQALLLLIRQARVQNTMRIDNIVSIDSAEFDTFVSPESELLEETEDELLEFVANTFTELDLPEDQNEDAFQLEPPPITVAQASEAIEKLVCFEEQRSVINWDFLRILCRLQGQIWADFQAAREAAKEH